MSEIYIASPNWKTSKEGRFIELWRSRHAFEKRERKATDQSPIFLIGGVHGDEPEGINLASDTLAMLKETSLETVRPWIVIPCLNVDGQAHDTRVNGNKVDLNRNYPSKNWSPEFKTERYFPGKSPASEVEVQAVVEIIEKYAPVVVIHCHSYDPCIVLTGEPGRAFAEPLGRATGYEIVASIGYDTPGSLSSYGWHDLKIPIICIEEREEEKREATWARFKPAMQAIFRKE